MTEQLNLFTAKVCSYCGKGAPSPRNPYLWDGFRDIDTGHLVCHRCRDKHYSEKAEATYSEFPELLVTHQP